MAQSKITLDELIVLSDEIRSLARSGVPLGSGLRGVAKDFQGRLRDTAQQLGDQLESGQPLEEVLSNPLYRFPPIFQALVNAGNRCGRLPAALEGFCESVDRTVRLRRLIAQSLVYPMIVLALVVGLSIVILPSLAAVFRETTSLQLFRPSPRFIKYVRYTEDFGEWIWIIPAVLIGLLAIWFVQTRLSLSGEPNWFARRTSWIPWAGRILRYGRMASFCEMLSVLVQQNVPVHEAMLLAAKASGDRELVRFSRQYYERLNSGNATIEFTPNRSLTPMMQWLLTGNKNDQQLTALLDDAAKSYRNQAEGLVRGLQLQLPVFLSLLFGGTFTLGYTMAVVLPWCTLMYDIGTSLGRTY